MRARAWVVALAVVLTGCTRVIDTAQPTSELPVAPITAGQVGELLSPEVAGGDGNLFFQLQPPVNSGSPEIVLWSFRAVDWACDSAFVAAHNAAVEISTCGPAGGYDVLSLAQDALKRIEALANTTA